MTGRVIRVVLPLVTKRANQTRRMHWGALRKYRRELSAELAVALGTQRPREPFARAHVRIERHSSGTADYDGFVGGLKDLIDCLLPLGSMRLVNGKPVVQHPFGLALIADDKPAVMELEPVQVKVSRKDPQRTVIIITELLAPGGKPA